MLGDFMRRLVTFFAVLVMGSATLAPAHAAASDTYESQVLKSTNAARVAKDRVALKHSPCLDRYAESWATYMASKRKLVHRSTASLKKVMSKCKLSLINENIARGYTSGPAVVRGWLNSPGHRANIMNTKTRIHGVGAVYAGGQWWVVQNMARYR